MTTMPVIESLPAGILLCGRTGCYALLLPTGAYTRSFRTRHAVRTFARHITTTTTH